MRKSVSDLINEINVHWFLIERSCYINGSIFRFIFDTRLLSLKMKIYVMGYGRSGSTLFETMLIDKFKVNSFGEIKYFAERGAIKNELCACGESASDCVFWSEIKKEFDEDAFLEISRLTNRLESSKLFFINLLFLKMRSFKEGIKKYQEFNERVYGLLGEHGGFIDSSKMPARVFFLDYGREKKFFDKIYWIVRDPRGVAWSCMKDVARPEAKFERDENMPKFGYYSSLVKWLINSIVGYYVYKRYDSVDIVRYEDVIDSFEMRAEGEGASEFIPLKHSISGNPRRFTGGLKQVKKDVEWVKNLSRFKKNVAFLLCFPMVQYFGYKRK